VTTRYGANYHSITVEGYATGIAELGALSPAGTVLSPRYRQSLEFTLRELRSIL
jgi:hypothetical protein